VARIRLPKDLGLRQRMVVFFSLTALVAALSLSVVTYFSTRSYLLEQRTLVAQRQAFNNAQLMRSLITTADADIAELITQIRTEQGGYAVLLQQQTADPRCDSRNLICHKNLSPKLKMVSRAINAFRSLTIHTKQSV
jgi:cell division protein FtsL